MSLGRRKVGIHETSRWVFNRMADVYDARPAYPVALLEELAALAGPRGSRVCDVGAGIGHVALPLAERGFDVVAIEPAQAMLEKLLAAAVARGVSLRALHGAAEALPVESRSFELVVVADALHFLDAQLVAGEIARVLAPGGALAVVTCEFGDTPYMRDVVEIIEDAVPRRPRDLRQQMVHLSAITGVSFDAERRFHDQTPTSQPTLERILRSISFIGPAMNARRFENFRTRISALPQPPIWARTFVLRWGRRSRTNPTPPRLRFRVSD